MANLSEKEIILTAARYVVLSKNNKNLAGLMAGEHHFLIGGESSDETSRYKPWLLRRGWAIDILADRMEGGEAFALYIGGSPNQATNPNIFKLVPFNRQGLTVLPSYNRTIDTDALSKMDFSETETETGTGLVIKVPSIQQRSYMDLLRTSEGFRRYSEYVDLTDSRLHQKAVMSRIERLFNTRDDFDIGD
ncbi:hypothetical protein HYT24_02880 [Candidatus Pacearchaeota archaeon]|nr:hypothetical protein [Candidatus Pacearchaeota archaeon]